MTQQNFRQTRMESEDTRQVSHFPFCRSCGSQLEYLVCDLGMSPLANAYVNLDQVETSERFYPIRVYACGVCFLMQLPSVEAPAKLFGDYAYFSSYSETWLNHARAYVESVCHRFALGFDSQVVEIGSNDGYLLQYFVERGIPAFGVEPASNVAKVAVDKGVPTFDCFFSDTVARRLATAHGEADLVIVNNVLAHVPDLNDFVHGLRRLLDPTRGVVTIEVPHVARLIDGAQLDTIYHEHLCYFSLFAMEHVLSSHGLRVFDVEELETHGGSIRVYACVEGSNRCGTTVMLEGVRHREKEMGLHTYAGYSSLQERFRNIKFELLNALLAVKASGQRIVGYGAPAKSCTLLNYCGIGEEFLDYTVDRSPHKQGLLLPGTHIPIYHPDKIRETKPDVVLILAWNLKDEIMGQMADIRSWGGRFLVPIPEATIL